MLKRCLKDDGCYFVKVPACHSVKVLACHSVKVPACHSERSEESYYYAILGKKLLKKRI